MEKTDGEEWRPIEGYPGYFVSNLGRVYGLSGRLLKQATRLSYKRVNLWKKEEGYKTHSVHLLVLNAFIGPCPEGKEAFHKNNDPGNNYLSNLKWESHSKNVQYAYDCGRKMNMGCFGKEGEQHIGSKLTTNEVLEIRRLHKRGVKQNILARQFGISKASICLIVNRKQWTHI